MTLQSPLFLLKVFLFLRISSTQIVFVDCKHLCLYTSPLDLNGTSIISNKPLTVISGHERTNIPNVCCCEHLTMQIPPTATWNKRFLLIPYSGRTRQYYKIIAANGETVIKYTCGRSVDSCLTIYLFNAGDVSLLSSDNGIYCSLVDKSVLVAQLGPS